jgi:N-methylhydantoinase B
VEIAERNSPLFFHEKRMIPGSGGRRDVRLNGKRIDNRKQHMLKQGDTLVLRTPGGGGYGPPRERDRALAKRDRALGYVLRKKRNG